MKFMKGQINTQIFHMFWETQLQKGVENQLQHSSSKLTEIRDKLRFSYPIYWNICLLLTWNRKRRRAIWIGIKRNVAFTFASQSTLNTICENNQRYTVWSQTCLLWNQSLFYDQLSQINKPAHQQQHLTGANWRLSVTAEAPPSFPHQHKIQFIPLPLSQLYVFCPPKNLKWNVAFWEESSLKQKII